MTTGESKYLYAALGGMKGVIEFPAWLKYQDLIKEFPEAKVILTSRTPESWARSIKSILFQDSDQNKEPLVSLASLFSDRFNAAKILGYMYKEEVEDKIFEGVFEQKKAECFFIQHNQNVRECVSEGQLLEMGALSG